MKKRKFECNACSNPGCALISDTDFEGNEIFCPFNVDQAAEWIDMKYKEKKRRNKKHRLDHQK